MAFSRSWLRKLGDVAGLASVYTNARGDEQPIADETLRTLLTALGIAADTETIAGLSVAEIDDRGWGRALEPVFVVEHDEPSPGVPVVVAGTAKVSRVDWAVRTENGSEFTGSAMVAEMPVLERRGDRFRRRLNLPLVSFGFGYHHLEVHFGKIAARATLIVTPHKAFTPEHWDRTSRDWAVTAQLYSLRSARNWGIGDFTDLGVLGRDVAARGASAVGLNPLHALFSAKPDHVSPYSPSSRTFLNPVYLDVTRVPDFGECKAAQKMVDEAAFQSRLAATRAKEFVDYPEVWELKSLVLHVLHRWFRDHHLGASGDALTARGRAFRHFGVEKGESLQTFAVFEALQDHFRRQGASLGWRDWPTPFRDPASAVVSAFAQEHAERVEYSAYLQWEADRQLAEAARAMQEAGMKTGLYRDTAVGVDPDGAEAWSDRALFVTDASVGAPPDIYNPMGQDWGLTPLNPIALRDRGYAPFIATLRANMRHAGAIRIDHVIGLKRLWWVPRGSPSSTGTYVAYPFDDLIRIVVLESHRHRCLVVGEDLGTVPEGFREEMQRRGVLSYRLLLFERQDGDGDFLPPSGYPASAAAAISTHDLATLRGLWRGRDLEWRRRLTLYPTDQDAESEATFRAETRDRLVAALIAHGSLSEADGALLLTNNESSAGGEDQLTEAAHRFLARARSRLLLVQLEDLLGEVEQMNLPGTIDEHPNWRRKLAHPIEALFDEEKVEQLTSIIDEARRAPAAALQTKPS